MSGWASRLGSWASSGAYSPFGRPETNNAAQVSDADFSYITADDLREQQRQSSHSHHDDDGHRHHHHHSHHHHDHSSSHHRDSRDAPLAHSVSHTPRISRPARETDLLVFRHQKIQYPVHFPAYSISDGHLTVGQAREHAAKKLNVRDPRRIRMFWKGRNLKDDATSCRDNGLRSEVENDVLCVIGEALPDSASDSSCDSANDDDNSASGSAAGSATKKKRRANRKKKPAARRTPSARDSPAQHSSGYSTPSAAGAEHLPVPTGTHPLHRGPSATSSPRQPSPAAAAPQTPQGKLEAIETSFRTSLLPLAEQFLAHPPPDKAKRDFEHKKLTETIMAQVLLKLDGVETEGDEAARAKRKALVKEVQAWLNRLDAS